ncbi:MAG: hypothetical protein PHY02_05600 [Phycisphaerae bacterium]|nr:hypothetical protein [Phycisphaerae bacterium]
MGKRRRLTGRQLTVLHDLFNSDLDEQGVLDKHKVYRSTYERWLTNKVFAEQFKRCINGLRRRSELLMAKYCCLAAAKLVELTASDKAETARRACLDIISALKAAKDDGRGTKDDPSSPKGYAEASGREAGGESLQVNTALTPETASRLLAAMAEEKIAK